MRAPALAELCHGHLAGRLGAAVCEAMIAAGRISLTAEGPELTRQGLEFFENFGVELGLGDESRDALCRFCRDGSDGRPHLAGVVGAALAARCLDLGWVKAVPGQLIVTETGRHELVETFGLTPDWDQLSR